jgi:hypothetical protein
MRLRPATLALAGLVGLLSPGCCLFRAKPCTPPETIVPLAQLVSEYNDNASRVPQLWARAKIEVTVPTKLGIGYSWGSTSERAEHNGLLLLFKGESPLGPHDFALIGREVGVSMPIFKAGTSIEDGAYYFWYGLGEESALYWGHNEYAGAPGIRGLPVDPLQLLAVLCVCELPDDFTRVPTVVRTMDTTPGQCAYVVSFLDRQPVSDHLVLRREVRFRWGEDEPRLPYRVDFLDAKGVRVMIAELSDYRPIALTTGSPDEGTPQMPTDIRIEWPAKKSRLHLVLSEMVVDETRGHPDACLLWDLLPEHIRERTQVDRAVMTGVVQP